MNDRNDDKFTHDIAQRLESSMERGDQELLRKLAHMRTRALEQIPDKGKRHLRRRSTPWLVAAGAGSFVCALVAGLLIDQRAAVNRLGPGEAIAGIEILVQEDELEMFQREDIDFYLWLESEDV